MKARKFFEFFFEGLIRISGTVTALTVLLIVVYLFKEGAGVIGAPPLEDELLIAVNKENPVDRLSPRQVKDIFDQEITNWKDVGGKDDSILLFRMDDVGNYFTEEQLGSEMEKIPECINIYVDSVPGVLAFFSEKYVAKDFKGKRVEVEKVSIKNLMSGKEWFPTAQPVAQLGVLPLFLGTLWVSVVAILIALPLGLAAAIYLAEIANDKVRRVLKPLIELLAGIPSVVYGFFGLVIIVPRIQVLFNLPVGETALTGSIILAIMALPTIITISEDALRTTPRAMKEASLALGASQWQTIYRVVVPYASSGITAAAILGIGRAMGETMAVLMVTGNAAVIPHTLLEPVRTIPATIAAELGEAPFGGLHYQALFALGCLLFVMTLVVNLLVEAVSAKRKKSNS